MGGSKRAWSATREKRGEPNEELALFILGIGGDAWEFGISGGPATVDHVKIIDQQNGAYVMEFALPARGSYNFRLLLDGNHVQGSPWRVNAQ